MVSDTSEKPQTEKVEPVSAPKAGKPKLSDTGMASMQKAETKDTKPPPEAYDRQKHYGNTPTRADREKLGIADNPNMVADHNPPLVKRYYEGDPNFGGKRGWELTDEQRKESAKLGLKPQPIDESRAQGGKMSAYAKEKKQAHGLS